jgi:hypothetical protein
MSAQRELSLTDMIALYHGRACYLTWLAGRKNQSYEVSTTTVAGGSADFRLPLADCHLPSSADANPKSAINNWQSRTHYRVVVLTYGKAATLKIP